MAVRMQQRRATAEQWLLADPILEPGEIGYETDTNSFKIGDGINNWSLLDYFETSTALQGTIDDYIPLTQKGAALGVAELDANGFVPVSQLGNIIDSAPEALDTLNELAAALSDDANAFSTLTAYADQAEADAISAANSYTDSAVAAAQPTFTNNFMLMGA